LRVEPTAFVDDRVGVQRGQSRELAHHPANAHTVAFLDFVTVVVDGAEHVDAVRRIDQGEPQALRVVVPSVNDAAQLARGVDAVQDALVVGPADLNHVVHRVRQVGRQDVDDHRLNAEDGAARRDGHRQFHILLKLGVFLVDRCEGECLAVQQARFKREVEREHGREVVTGRCVSASDGDLDVHIFQRVAHQHLHLDSTSFGHIQLWRGKAHHHRAQTTARRRVLSQEIERVLGVDVPLGLAFVPVGGTLAHVGFADQCELRHGAFAHRPCAERIFANHPHHVDDFAILPQDNGVVSIEPSHSAQGLALVDNRSRRLGVAQHVNPARRDDALEVQGLNGHLRAVVVHLHDVGGQIHLKRRGVVDLQRLVVARALHVFADDQVVAQPRRAALKNGHWKGVGGQAVAPQRAGLKCRRTHFNRGGVQPVLVAQSPHVVVPRFAKRRKVEVRLVCGGQNLVGLVADEEHVAPFYCVAVVPKRHKGAVFGQACLCFRFSSRGQERASIAGWDLARFPCQGHRCFRHTDAPSFGEGRQLGQGLGPFCQRQIVRDGVDLKRTVSQSLHVDGGADKQVEDGSRLGVHHGQAGGRAGRIADVGEADNGWPQVCAECGDVGVVQRQVTAFAGQHVG